MFVFRAALPLVALILPLLATPAGSQVPAKEPPSKAAVEPALVPVIWLEPADAKAGAEGRGGTQTFRLIPSSDPRVRDAERLIDNEPARFTRRLVAWAWRTFDSDPDWPERRLPIVLRPGGNNAGQGFRLVSGGGTIEEHPTVPFLVLELDSRSLSDTLIHEGGHLLHSIATRGHRATSSWSAILHTTFAETDPLTAVSEGYAIHFDTLRRGLGPILPVSAAKVVLELKVLRQKFPLEFDRNAATEAEWAAVGVDARTSARCLSERDRLPFSSVADFQARTGVTLQALGLTPVSAEVGSRK